MAIRRPLTMLALCACIALPFGGALHAQLTPGAATSPLRVCCVELHGVSMRRDTLPSLLRVTRNAADFGTTVAGPSQVVMVELGTTSGSLRRPQDAESIEYGRARAEGMQRVGSWRTAGAVGYAREREQNVRWRHGHDAYAGNSYLWADSVGGDFQRDELVLEGTIATPAWRGVTFGVHSDHALGQGARRNDPRPLFRRRVMDMAPAITFSRGGHSVGVGALAGWYREDLEIGGGTSSDYPVLFRLRGIGTFDRTQLISAQREIHTRAHGGNAAYAFAGTRWRTALGTTLRVELDSVRDGVATPQTGGATRRTRVDVHLSARHASASRGTLELNALLRSAKSRGVDPVFRGVNAIDEGDVGIIDMSWWAGSNRIGTPWLINASFGAHRIARSDIAAETNWNATMPIWSAGVLRRFAVGDGAVDIFLGTRAQLSGASRFRADRPSLLTPILARYDYDIVRQRRLGLRASAAWQPSRMLAGTRRIRVEADYTNAANRLQRTTWRLHLEQF